MAKFGRRSGRRRQSIDASMHITQSIFKRLDPNELDFLVRHLRVGLASIDDIHDIFLSHARLAISIVSESIWALNQHFNDIHDLIQTAMLAMMQAIHAAPKALYDNNITPYLATRIRGAIIDQIVINRQYLTITPRHLRRKGANYFLPICQQIKGGDIAYGEWLVMGEPAAPDELKLFEIMEVIEKVIIEDENLKRREYKRVIIRLRAAGYNSVEIAKIIEMSETFVKSLLNDVKERFFAKY